MQSEQKSCECTNVLTMACGGSWMMLACLKERIICVLGTIRSAPRRFAVCVRRWCSARIAGTHTCRARPCASPPSRSHSCSSEYMNGDSPAQVFSITVSSEFKRASRNNTPMTLSCFHQLSDPNASLIFSKATFRSVCDPRDTLPRASSIFS